MAAITLHLFPSVVIIAEFFIGFGVKDMVGFLRLETALRVVVGLLGLNITATAYAGATFCELKSVSSQHGLDKRFGIVGLCFVDGIPYQTVMSNGFSPNDEIFIGGLEIVLSTDIPFSPQRMSYVIKASALPFKRVNVCTLEKDSVVCQ